MPVVHLVALGTRGDVAPAVTVAAQLRARGHDVLVHGADRYAGLAAAESVPYRAAGDVDLFGSTPTSRRLALSQAGITYALLRRRYRAWSAGLWARLRDDRNRTRRSGLDEYGRRLIGNRQRVGHLEKDRPDLRHLFQIEQDW